MTKDCLVGIAEVARRLDTTPTAIYKRLQRHRMIPAPCTAGRPWKWRESDVDRFIGHLSPLSDLERARLRQRAAAREVH